MCRKSTFSERHNGMKVNQSRSLISRLRHPTNQAERNENDRWRHANELTDTPPREATGPRLRESGSAEGAGYRTAPHALVS